MMIQEELDTLKLSLLFPETTYPFDREYVFHGRPEGGTMLIGLRFKLPTSILSSSSVPSPYPAMATSGQ